MHFAKINGYYMQELSATSSNNTSPNYFETVIIGTGFSGLLAAIRLKKKNCNDFVLLERDPEIGGTWRDNAYPGAEVDIPTGLYSISFVPYQFKKKYSTQSELLDYTKYIVKKFHLKEKTKTNQTVTKLTFDEKKCIWHVETESGKAYSARFIIDTSGVLANPHIPSIKGAESFKGTKFHSGQWNHNVPYKGKRLGVIGSGCSAAQIVPAIADKVSKLTLFMGKAQWIIPRSDRSYNSTERYLMNLPIIRQINRFIIFGYHEVRFVAFRRYPFTMKISKFIKKLYTRTLRINLEKFIDDDKLRQHMMPDYELGCRRVIPTNTYLPALAKNNVDVDISGIESITPTGIRTKEGKDIPLDIIVYATGFFAYSNMKKALTFQVYGIDGRNLNSEWEEEVVSYKGITVSGYPNYFKVNGPNTGTGHGSQISYMETMVKYIGKAICEVKQNKNIKAINVKSNIQDNYVKKMQNQLKSTVWQSGDCTAFYQKNMSGIVTSLSPESMVNFIFTRKWFNLKDYELLKGNPHQEQG